MNVVGHYFRAEILIIFTLQEIRHLIRLSESHYDARCRSLSAGRGCQIDPITKAIYKTDLGRLRQIERMMLQANPQLGETEIDKDLEVQLEWGDMDTLCKILESESMLQGSGSPRMAVFMAQAFADMRRESERVNKPRVEQ